MKTDELCDLLNVSPRSKEKELKLTLKLGPIISRFRSNGSSTNSSIIARKGARSHRECKYLERKGLLRFEEEGTIKSEDVYIYKLTSKATEAYEAYENLRKCAA